MRQTYIAVAERIRQELADIDEVVNRAQKIWGYMDTVTADDYRLDAVALNLHGFYAGLERIFEMIATRIDETVPRGSHWHQELLNQMRAPLANTRPAVLSETARKKLDTFRGFRHVVRNVYTFDLDPAQLHLLMQRLPETWERTSADLQSFADTLQRLASDTDPPTL
jgi:hypothetical protein